jgi:phosphopantothenoylcysteine decarboxylase/phosphopantothenate--cysteine ligase
VRVRRVETALELSEAMTEEAAAADVIIMAAAVADYRPAEVAERKIKKDESGDSLTLELIRNPDILTALAADRRDGQVVIGFAAETEADREKLLELGREKVARKGADFLVLNRVGWTEGFGEDRNTVVVVSGAGDIVTEASGSKDSVAHSILDLLS